MKEYIVRCETSKITVDKEIVRCKDCKWFDSKRANFIDGYGYCERYEVTDRDSHYCSYGEKQVTGKLNNPDDSLVTEDSETCNDLISRQGVIDLLLDAQDGSGQIYEVIRDLLHEVAYMPPVEPKRPKTTETMMVDGEPTEIDPESYEVGYTHGQSERPKGKWKYGNGNGECPFCGREKQRGWDNFCGYCGADMRGEK